MTRAVIALTFTIFGLCLSGIMLIIFDPGRVPYSGTWLIVFFVMGGVLVCVGIKNLLEIE